MRNRQHIIEEYRDADAEKRVYLFLSHRSLRDEFLDIDQNDTSAGFSETRIKSKCRRCRNWGQSLINAFNLN